MARKEDSRITHRANSQLNTIVFEYPRTSKQVFWYLLHKFLFSQIGMSLHKWDALVKKFVNDPENGIAQNPEARTSARGNLSSQVFPEDKGMSFSTFLKASAVCGAKHFKMIGVWEMEDGRRFHATHTHALTPEYIRNVDENEKEMRFLEKASKFYRENQDNEELLENLYKRPADQTDRKQSS